MNIDYMQLEYKHINLRLVMRFLEDATGLSYTITSQYRIGDKGVHGTMPLRADDLRVRLRKLAELLAEIINEAWVYDPERPEKKVAIAHGEGAHLHLHLQVHDNTVRR